MEKLKTLPIETNQFTANGTLYTFEENLSIARYQVFERFRLEVGFGLSVNELQDILKQNVDFCERFAGGEKVFSEMTALNYNTLKGVVNLASKEPYAIWMCTLFFNAEQEDRRWFDEAVMRKKIVDWQEEGIDTGFFIKRACSLIADFYKLYDEITQMSLAWLPGENPEGPGTSPDPRA